MPRTKSLDLKRDGMTDGFAERFGMEIPEGTLVFIEGLEGAGKSILCQRFLISFLRNGYSSSYLSTQFSVKSFVRQMSSLNYDIKKYLLRGTFFFISTECVLAESLPKSTFLDKLFSCKSLFEYEIVFIDSISTLLNESLTPQNQVDLINFFNRWKGAGKIIILTANPKEWDERIHKNFRLNSDMHFEISIKNIPGVEKTHEICLHKFNGAQHNYQTTTSFYVRPKVGMCIESTHVAF
jgi:flagellar protein FlaH